MINDFFVVLCYKDTIVNTLFKKIASILYETYGFAA